MIVNAAPSPNALSARKRRRPSLSLRVAWQLTVIRVNDASVTAKSPCSAADAVVTFTVKRRRKGGGVEGEMRHIIVGYFAHRAPSKSRGMLERG